MLTLLRRRPVLSILVLSLVLRGGMLLFMPLYPPQDDTQVYLRIAKNVVSGWGFSIDNDGDGIPEMSSREPGYPFFLAGLIWLFGSSAALDVARIIQVVLNSVAVLAVYGIGSNLFSARTAAIGGMLFAIHPGLIIESSIPGHEGLTIPFLLFGLWFVIKGKTTDRVAWFAAAGLAFGIGAMIKQTLIVVPMLVATAALADRARFVRRLVHSAVMLMVVGLAIAPWVIRTITVRNDLARLVAQVMAEQPDATRSEMRAKGLDLHHQVLKPLIQSGQALPDATVPATSVARMQQPQKPRDKSVAKAGAVASPRVPFGPPLPPAPVGPSAPAAIADGKDLTMLARATYELYEGDPRRSLPLLSGSGGDVELLLARPFQFAKRVVNNATNVRIARDVFLVPYENRYVELLYPNTPRMSAWLAGNAVLDPGLFLKMLFTFMLPLVHFLMACGVLMSVRNRSAWPVLLTIVYFYAVPLVHTAPLSRFVFLATPLMLLYTAVALSQGLPVKILGRKPASNDLPTAPACA